MIKGESTKLIPLHIIEILQKYTSKEKKFTQAEVLNYLDTDYGEVITRHTLTAFISAMEKEGYIHKDSKKGLHIRQPATCQQCGHGWVISKN